MVSTARIRPRKNFQHLQRLMPADRFIRHRVVRNIDKKSLIEELYPLAYTDGCNDHQAARAARIATVERARRSCPAVVHPNGTLALAGWRKNDCLKPRGGPHGTAEFMNLERGDECNDERGKCAEKDLRCRDASSPPGVRSNRRPSVGACHGVRRMRAMAPTRPAILRRNPSLPRHVANTATKWQTGLLRTFCELRCNLIVTKVCFGAMD